VNDSLKSFVKLLKSGRSFAQVSLRAVNSSRVRPDAGQPHLHSLALPTRPQGLRQDEEGKRVHRTGSFTLTIMISLTDEFF
jgi:hypothetical protein